MSVHKLYWKVRDQLVDWGVIEAPRFYMQRQRVGANRQRMLNRGACPRMRRLSLPQLLRMSERA